MTHEEPPDRQALRAELKRLERAERAISAVRRRLHDQLDYGFANTSTALRERKVSDQRRALHAQIDALEAQISALLRQTVS
ncbi:MAG TPA: hypothetical protein VGC78_00520 [Gaiellaceae bacterium]|jgi:hypothetical protein